MALDSKSGSRKINQNVDLAPGARDLTTTGNITAGAFYGDGSHLTGISTASANDALITIVAGGGLTGGGGFTVDQAVDADITVSHSDTSSQASVANTAFNVIQSITLDTYGHVTAIGSKDIGTAGFYVKTTGETGTGVKIGLGSLTYQTVQFFAGTGLSVVRTDNEIQFSAPNAANWDTAYSWGNHANNLYLPLSGGTLTGAITQISDDYLKIYSATTTTGAGIRFSDLVPGYAQYGDIKYFHADAKSYGSGNAFEVVGSESTMTFLVRGKVMYTEGIYTAPATGTGAGTRKDTNWDTAYSWGNHNGLYLPLTGKAADSELIDGFDSTALYRQVYADNYGASPTSRWYVVTLPYSGGSGWSDYFYFDVLAYRDIGNLQSQLHYRVYLHNRGISANNNQLNASVVTELEQPLEFAEFGYKSGVASSSQFFIKLGEDYSGISIVAYPGENTITASMIASVDTAPTGFTAVTPTKYAKDTINLQDVTSNGNTTSNSITALSFVKSGGTSSQFLKADGTVDTTSYSPTTHTHTSEDITGWYARDTTNIDTFDPDGNWTTAISTSTTLGTKPTNYVNIHNLGGNGVDFQTQIATYYGNNNRTWIRSRYDVTNSWVAWDELITSANIGSQSVSSAATLTNAKTINGTSFNGSANITTDNWGTARTLTIGNTGKSVNGSANVSWSLAEIGALGATAKAADSELLDGIDSSGFSRVYRGTASFSNAAFVNVFNVSGDALASAVRFSVQGTTGSVVVNVLADLLVNHYQDILINTQSGFYTTLSIRVQSNQNEAYSVLMSTNSANVGTFNIEVFPLNNETITFGGTATTGVTLTHVAYYGNATSGSGGNTGDIRTAGSFIGNVLGSSLTWANARTLTIGNTGKSVNGSADVSWSLAEIGALPLTGGTVSGQITASGGIEMNNTNITGVNHIVINDAGVGEGIEWAGGNGWKIYEAPDALTNAAGSLQFVTVGTRRAAIDSAGNVFALGSSRAPIFYDSNDTTYYLDPASTSLLNTVRLGTDATQTFAQLNISQGIGSATVFRDIDLKGSWSAGEGHAITATHGTTSTNIVGQMVFHHDSPGSRIKFGRLYHSGDQSTYPMHLISSGSSAYLEMNTGDMRAPIFYDSDNTGYYLDPSTTGLGLNMLGRIVSTAKEHRLGESTNWDLVGFSNLTNLHFQGHSQFWIGAGNGTWFAGTGNTKNQSTGLAADASYAHDLLITTMQSTSTYDRGITFAVDSGATGSSGWRLGKWHSGDAKDSSKFVVDGQIFAKAGYTDEFDYYADDYSTYYSSQGGLANWSGDTNAGWHVPAIVASSAIQIQSGNNGTNSRKPQIQFHQYGYGGPAIEYDGPNKKLQIGAIGTATNNRLDTFSLRLGGTNECFIVNTDYAFHNSDMRSPIFYDSNNTGYYVDPSGTSNFAGLTVANTITGNISGSAGSVSWGNVSSKPASWLNDAVLIQERAPSEAAFPSGFYQNYNGSGNPTGTWFNFINVRHSNTGNGHGYQLGMSYYDNNLWFRSYQGSTSPTFQSWEHAIGSGGSDQTKSGYLQSNSSLRAPVFYDADNTGYFVDPTSTSILSTIQISTVSSAPYISLEGTRGMGLWGVSSIGMRTVTDTWSDPNYHGIRSTSTSAAWGDDISINSYHDITMRIDSNGNNADGAFRIYTDTTASSNLRFFFDYAGTGEATGSFRAPLFYDSNNTGYYTDPASTSNLNVVNANSFAAYAGEGREVMTYLPSSYTTNDLVSGHEYGWYNDHWRLGMTRSNSSPGADFVIQWNGSRRLSLTNSGNLSVTGSITASGDVTAYSDASIKENIQTIDNALEKVVSMRGVSYNRTDIDDKSTKIGVIAQEIQKVLPEVVQEQEDGLLGVSYGNITAVLIEAIKEQQKQIEELKAIVNGLTK